MNDLGPVRVFGSRKSGDIVGKQRYLTDKQVAELIGQAVQSLKNDRCNGVGLPYVKLKKTVRYDYQDVIEYMEKRKVRF